jgi:SAM-dependent methyltransferase
MTAASTGPIVPDYAMVKGRQKAAWSSGNYAVVGTTLQIVGEMLCEAVDLRSGENVLDVAAGNGNATLAAARRFAKVTSTDYVGALLDLGSERAKAERLDIAFQQADAENLPYEASSFDVVLSTFGVMFTPDHRRAATELLRVCRPGGRIGLANWTPASFIGNVFRTIGKYVPPPAESCLRPSGARQTTWRRCSAVTPRSPPRSGTSISATSRQAISSRSSAPTTVQS